MKRIAFFIVLLALVAFLVPTYAGKPAPGPDQVEVVNTTDNPVPVVMDGASSNGAVIKGINRADGTVTALSVDTKFELVRLTEPGTFVGARVYVDADSGGDPNSVRVELVIDGNTIVNDTFSEIGEAGAVTMTPFGIFRTNYGVHVGFQQPVSFDSGLTLSATIESVATIYAIQGSVIYGE